MCADSDGVARGVILGGWTLPDTYNAEEAAEGDVDGVSLVKDIGDNRDID
jgi:hypothetical protein